MFNNCNWGGNGNTSRIDSNDKADEFSNCNWGGNGNTGRIDSNGKADEFSNCNWGGNGNTGRIDSNGRAEKDEFNNCNWGGTGRIDNSGRADENEFNNCNWGGTGRIDNSGRADKDEFNIEPQQVRPSNIIYVDGIEDYRKNLPLMRVEEIASVFFLHISRVSVLDVKRIMPSVDADHYAVVELGTVDQAKKAISILNGITLSTGHTLSVSFSRVPFSFVPSNFILLKHKAEKRRNDLRTVVEEHPVEGELFSAVATEMKD